MASQYVLYIYFIKFKISYFLLRILEKEEKVVRNKNVSFCEGYHLLCPQIRAPGNGCFYLRLKVGFSCGIVAILD